MDDGRAMSRTVAIVGGGLAGLRAAEQLRAAGWDEHIVVLGAEPHLPYNRPPLTKAALRDGVDPAALAFRRRPTTEDVEWRLGVRVTAADLAGHTLTLADGSTVSFDGLVVASGVSSRRLVLDAPHEWRHAIRTAEDAAALHRALQPGARVVVIGAGFIGCEVAATAAGLGCSVTVVEPFAVPLERQVGELVGAEIQRRHEEHGVTFRLGRTVSAVEGDEETGPSGVLLSDGSRIEADVVVEAVGSVANTGWLEGQGLDLSSGVLCDENLHPLTAAGPLADVVVVGDVARFPVPMYGGAPFRVEHWTMPTDMAAHAARSLVAGLTGAAPKGPPFNPVPTFWSDQYGVRMQSFGLPALGLGDVRVLEGDLREEAVVGYHHDGVLVGVVLLGMGKQMVTYRQKLVAAASGTDLVGGSAR
jgi:3-phenylpropionate/trans-cinnamate dioxygenase ferredoxin reductase component